VPRRIRVSDPDARRVYRRRRITLGLVLALLGLGVAGAGFAYDRYLNDDDSIPTGPAPQTDLKTMWGPITGPDGKSLFPTFRDLGVGVYATQIHWDTTAPKGRPRNPTDPNDPAYVWPAYVDYSVKEARKQNIDLMIQLIGTPPWANGGKTSEWAPEQNSDFTDFAIAAAKRYKDVRLWMIWGEPNRGPNFQPLTPASTDEGPLNKKEQVAPQRYAGLLDASYEALKGANPKNMIIGGNTYTNAGPGDINTYQWIEYLKLPDGSRPRMDIWGHNPYGFHEPDLDEGPSRDGNVAFQDLDDLAEALDEAYPDQELPLYLTEWGVPIGYKDLDLTYSLDQEEGEEWIRAGFEIARDWDRIYSLGWVHPVDTPYSSQGLLNKRGNPKPSYFVYKDV
jgi:Cellulase (glycosyl hydrolase family 5)